MKRMTLLLPLVLSLAAPPSMAFGFGVRAGTQGLGGDLGFTLGDDWSLRLGYAQWKYDRTLTITDIDYDATLKLANASALLEWHPWGPFRLTAGIVGTRNRISVNGLPLDTQYRINGTVYAASEIANLGGTVRVGKSVAPYVGFGYGIVARSGVNFYADLGVMYQGAPRAELSAACAASLTTERCTRLRSDVLAEQAQLANKVRNFKWYPTLNLGLTLGF